VLKYGTATVYEMAQKYPVKAGLHRWKVNELYNIPDLAVINAWVVNKMTTGRKTERRKYMIHLAEKLKEKYSTPRPRCSQSTHDNKHLN
jgi:hypothetical protein